ncbi:hypothetical protein G6L30_33485 [Agrobacterium rhizogenes]|nr:hypothetical protein [Rhizobium rhizogenes]
MVSFETVRAATIESRTNIFYNCNARAFSSTVLLSGGVMVSDKLTAKRDGSSAMLRRELDSLLPRQRDELPVDSATLIASKRSKQVYLSALSNARQIPTSSHVPLPPKSRGSRISKFIQKGVQSLKNLLGRGERVPERLVNAADTSAWQRNEALAFNGHLRSDSDHNTVVSQSRLINSVAQNVVGPEFRYPRTSRDLHNAMSDNYVTNINEVTTINDIPRSGVRRLQDRHVEKLPEMTAATRNDESREMDRSKKGAAYRTQSEDTMHPASRRDGSSQVLPPSYEESQLAAQRGKRAQSRIVPADVAPTVSSGEMQGGRYSAAREALLANHAARSSSLSR